MLGGLTAPVPGPRPLAVMARRSNHRGSRCAAAAAGGAHLLVGRKLVDALEVVVAADDVEGRAEAVEEILGELEALRRPREELLRLRAVLRLAQVTERDDERVRGALEVLVDVLTAQVGVVEVARVQLRGKYGAVKVERASTARAGCGLRTKGLLFSGRVSGSGGSRAGRRGWRG